ncbi:YdcF family protein [Aliiroseovarius sp. KMU-50]|uniref:YdcF family protein n=1 Tax=Aliiroseovarius salicola TaxID=3009082 RepID=A0ABT4VZG8_9RHOB|nr:YdcF family protein [Aliiroseovarius sp. KMU-50]MDA5093606.1 YdcF family protein [Aliiroseovarius sp. KMU-50]
MNSAPSRSTPRVALVLGAALRPDGLPSPALMRRARHAAELWHQGKAEQIIASGGMEQSGRSEAEAMQEVLIAEGVPESNIICEKLARNTWENLSLSRELLPDGAMVVLVTDRYHAFRAGLMAQRLRMDVEFDCPRTPRTPVWVRFKGYTREAFALLVFLFRLAVGKF